VAVRPGDGGDKPALAYKIDKSAPYVPTPVACGDLVFLWSDKGVVTCIDAATGEMHYRKRVGGNYSGSPVCVAGRLYCIAEDGEVVVLAASKKFEQLARNPLGDDSRATPAVADGKMYLRTYHALVSLGGK
jgi:outer membrane protein assembly factor BamB